MYTGQLLKYYDNTSNDARRTHEARWAWHYRHEYNKPGNWLRETALSLQETVGGRRVLELACGHCRWTPFIAEVAESVLATDLSPNMLQWGRRLFAYAAPKASNVGFRLADAFRPDEIDGTFNAAAVINFFQHVPRARLDEFLIFLHAKLEPGAQVFLAASHIKGKFREHLIRRGDDFYSRRKRPDGTTYEIIDNEFDEPSLRMLLESHVDDLSYTNGEEYWWVTYTVR
jgi:cyclopropane fatty-acyl-phospholipid synthase-like methyltransferase